MGYLFPATLCNLPMNSQTSGRPHINYIMSDAGDTPFDSTKLPSSLRRTIDLHGDGRDFGEECAICHDTRTQNSAILTHTDCGRWFDEDCLLEWMNSNHPFSTCPLCRGHLYDMWELSQADRYDLIEAVREDLPEPSEHHVRRTVAEAIEVFLEARPDTCEDDMISDIEGEVEILVDGVDFTMKQQKNSPSFGETSWQATTCDLMDRHLDEQDPLEFDEDSSLRQLWNCNQILGFKRWFLVQFEEIPEVGVWLPHHPSVCALENVWELEDRLDDGLFEHSKECNCSDMLAIPLTTDFLCDRLLPVNSLRGSTADSDELRAMADAHNITHWTLIPQGVRQGPEIFAVPWSTKDVVEGYKTLTYSEMAASNTRFCDLDNNTVDNLVRWFAIKQAFAPFNLPEIPEDLKLEVLSIKAGLCCWSHEALDDLIKQTCSEHGEVAGGRVAGLDRTEVSEGRGSCVVTGAEDAEGGCRR